MAAATAISLALGYKGAEKIVVGIPCVVAWLQKEEGIPYMRKPDGLG